MHEKMRNGLEKSADTNRGMAGIPGKGENEFRKAS